MLALKPVLYLHCLGFDWSILPTLHLWSPASGILGEWRPLEPTPGMHSPCFQVWVSKPGSERSEVQIPMAWVAALQSCHTCIKCGSSS